MVENFYFNEIADIIYKHIKKPREYKYFSTDIKKLFIEQGLFQIIFNTKEPSIIENASLSNEKVLPETIIQNLQNFLIGNNIRNWNKKIFIFSQHLIFLENSSDDNDKDYIIQGRIYSYIKGYCNSIKL